MGAPVDRYGVMGNPVTHSLSPTIHALFASSTEQHLRYEAIEVAIDGFEAAVSAFFENGDRGLSITVPFKEEAWKLADVKTERGIKARAVNTLWISDDGRLHGDNTDGVGLVRDLKDNHNISLCNARIAILGAGGAVRGVLNPVLQENPAEVVVANRTLSKAETLVAEFLDEEKPLSSMRVEASGFKDLNGTFDLVINGTAASLYGEALPVPKSIIDPNTVCYDMMYSSKETVFNQWAREAGAQQCLDGLGMLVEQAAEQFFIWRGVHPETAPVLKGLRENMKQP